MDPAEEIFVNTFVQKARRDRALFELGSEKKRGGFLNKLCHSCSEIFDSRLLQSLPGSDSTPEAILKLLTKNGAGSTCRVISCNSSIDGKDLALADALKASVGFGLPSILICVPNALAYFESEQEQGPAPRYLLTKR